MKFKDSQLAHKYLDDLKGIEIGAAHNAFNLPNCINVDYTDDMNTVFKQNEETLCGEKMPVDIVAEGDNLPFEDNSQDFVISSHVIEHFFDPVKTIKEWLRVVKPGGYVFMIVPHKDRVEGEHRPVTSYKEIVARHRGEMKSEEVNMEGAYGGSEYQGKTLKNGDPGRDHWSVWNLKEFERFCRHFNFKVVESQDPDDKAGNGFTVVIQK